MFRSIRWRVTATYVSLILTSMAILAFHLGDLVWETQLANLEDKLTAEAHLIGEALAASSAWREPGEDLDGVADRYAARLKVRVTIIDSRGTVLGESDVDREQMDNQLSRLEIRQALDRGEGSSIRFSRIVEYDVMYVAVPVIVERSTVGIVRVAQPLDEIEAPVARLRRDILVGALLIVLGAVLLAFYIAERTVRPVRQLTEVVQRVAQGDLGVRLLPLTRDEVGLLTRAFNDMTDRLRGTITTLVEERSRLTAVLDNMADGVVITDEEGYVRLINPAAVRLLATSEGEALGSPFVQVVRDYRLIGLWRECGTAAEEQFKSIEASRQGPFLHAIATPLQGAGSQACMVILQDLTQVRRLETVRRDFVSNISHELRTPLASLKALVETLRDGALEDPPAAQRFLDRIEVEVDALTQMVRELLELSRIESGEVPFQLSPVSVDRVVRPPVDRLRPQAERAGLNLIVDLPDGLPRVLADAERMQQVFTNLVHNAIKFTPPGGEIIVRALWGETYEQWLEGRTRSQPIASVSLADYAVVVIEDTGVGISADDLPRIFERFYKADRARSGGGTGLGLAIAKHIVQGHQGHIWADSAEGYGSTFYVAIPLLTPR